MAVQFRPAGPALAGNLPAKLRMELPGILRWIVEGAVRYLKEGIGEPPVMVRIATEGYRQESDVLAEFPSLEGLAGGLICQVRIDSPSTRSKRCPAGIRTRASRSSPWVT